MAPESNSPPPASVSARASRRQRQRQRDEATVAEPSPNARLAPTSRRLAEDERSFRVLQAQLREERKARDLELSLRQLELPGLVEASTGRSSTPSSAASRPAGSLVPRPREERLRGPSSARAPAQPRRVPVGQAKGPHGASGTTGATGAAGSTTGPTGTATHHAEASPLRPSTAPHAACRTPTAAARRVGRWTAAAQMRSTIVQDLSELVRVAQFGKGGKPANIEQALVNMLGSLQASQVQERMRYAEVACDFVSVETPSRLNDRGHGFPDGMSVTRPHHVAMDLRSGKEVATLRRVDGGGYVATVDMGTVEVRASSSGTALERARLLLEAAGR